MKGFEYVQYIGPKTPFTRKWKDQAPFTWESIYSLDIWCFIENSLWKISYIAIFKTRLNGSCIMCTFAIVVRVDHIFWPQEENFV